MRTFIVAVVALALVASASARLATPELNSCNLLKNETACDAMGGGSACVWCKCAAIPSGCFSPTQAAKLPKGVFDCQSSALVAPAPMFSFKSCANSDALLSKLGVSISPNPPTKGSDLTVSVSGDLSTSVSGGTLKYSISVIGIKLLSQTLDVCTGLGVTCPVAAGEQTFTLTQKIPSDVPSGTYTLDATATTTDGEQITCFSASLDL